MCNNSNLPVDVFKVNAYVKFDQSPPILEILSKNENLTITKIHNCVADLRKWMYNNPNLLRKHTYSNKLKISPPKNRKFSDKNSIIYHISAQNIDCGYPLEPPPQGGSNKYPQSMFLSRNKKNNVYHCKPKFYYIKVGFKGVKIV